MESRAGHTPQAPAAAPPTPDWSVTANVLLGSEYIFRGISQTGGKPTVQGGFDVAHSGGFYAGTWASNISWLEDFGAYNRSSLEWDFYGGFKQNFGSSDWFWDVNQSGGGVLMDMGCHAFGWFRWMLGGNPVVKSVWATMDTVRHKGRTLGEDNAVCVVEFDGGVIGLAEDGWAKPGGMDDRIEVYGTTGVSFADLFRGNAAQTYSEEGYGYAAEKAGSTQGWTFTIFEEVFNQGYPHELQHFIECVREDKTPLVTGEDGRAVLEIIYAAYASARSGAKVPLPFHPKVSKPIDLWK